MGGHRRAVQAQISSLLWTAQSEEWGRSRLYQPLSLQSIRRRRWVSLGWFSCQFRMSVRFRRDTLPHRSSVSCPARCSVFGYDQLTITSLFCLALIMQTTPLSTRTPVYAFLRAVLPLERRKKTVRLNLWCHSCLVWQLGCVTDCTCSTTFTVSSITAESETSRTRTLSGKLSRYS
jgi:hypothetical protein